MRTRICFASPGWFATDARIRISVDGAVVHEGSFLQGFAHELELAAGTHEVEAHLQLGFSRTKRWTFEVPEEHDDRFLDVRLAYSRTWGTFEKALDVREVESFEPLETEPEPTALDLERAKRPLRATWALLAMLIVVYAAELFFAVDDTTGMSPSLATLVAMGGLAHPAIADGQWYRVVSCTFLHVDPLHLVFNGVALAIAGSLLEKIVGWRWFLALYFAGALGGSALSLAVNDERLVSVGASGAIMGLFTAGLLLAQTLPIAQRGPVQMGLLRMLIPSLIPMFQRSGVQVDFGAHFGGAIAGLIAGALLLAAVRSASSRGVSIDRSPVAIVASAAFLAASFVALIAVSALAHPQARAQQMLMSALVPDAGIFDAPPNIDQVRTWSAQYPDDPRVQLMATELAYDDEEWARFDEQLARTRELMPRYAHTFPPEMTDAMLAALTQLEQQGALRRQLLPNRELPTGSPEEIGAGWSANLSEWLERHPADPRLRGRAAWRALYAGSLDEAELHARAGLESAPRFAELFQAGNPEEAGLHAALALVLHARGQLDEAATLAAPVCAGESELRALLAERGLCAAP